MKSKKIVALALTAALTVSAASMTAFASVEYTDGGSAASLDKVTAKITKDSLEATKALDENGDGNITLAEFGGLKDYTDLNTGTKTFIGWTAEESGEEPETLLSGESVLFKIKDDKSVFFGPAIKGAQEESDPPSCTLHAAYTTTTDDEQIAKNLKAIEERKAKQDAAKSREDHLNEEDKNHNATDNVNTGSGVETKPANVERKTDPVDPAGDTSANHDLQAAGVNVGANELAWVYEVTAPDKFMSSTKNARVTLNLPDGYTTSNYKVTVYHVKGWCSKQKVTGLDIGTYDVTFWANDFSPYVLILTPKGATSGSSTDNPGTGDFSAVPVALLAAAALGATGFVAYKKRKAE